MSGDVTPPARPDGPSPLELWDEWARRTFPGADSAARAQRPNAMLALLKKAPK